MDPAYHQILKHNKIVLFHKTIVYVSVCTDLLMEKVSSYKFLPIL